MPTLEEVSHWSVERLRAEIQTTTPPDLVFDIQTFPDYWQVSFKDKGGVEVWTEAHWNIQYVLIAAYGWLWLRREPPTGHPAWRPQPPRVLVPVRPLSGQKVDDPEDLDPVYLASVYAEHHRKKE